MEVDMSVIMLGSHIQDELNKLRAYFNPKIELTFIARLPGNNDADFVITNDSMDELIACLQRTKERACTDTSDP